MIVNDTINFFVFKCPIFLYEVHIAKLGKKDSNINITRLLYKFIHLVSD
jgi:hypothetical protein